MVNTQATTITGDLRLGNDLNLTSKGTLTFSGSVQVGNITSLDAREYDLDLAHAENDFHRLNVIANQLDLNDRNAVTLENIELVRQFNATSHGIAINSVVAEHVDLDAGSGAIQDINGDRLNFTANSVKLRAATGIAAETKTDALDVVNSTNTGRVAIRNHGAVTVHKLVNRGRIRFDNAGNVIVDQIDAGYDSGDLTLQIKNGSLYGIGPGRPRADITAHNALVNIPHGNFGTFSRPIVVSVKNAFTLFSLQSHLSYFPVKPNIINDNSTIKGSIFDALSSTHGQQLIEVESLGNIDPAVFTQVRNYTHDETAIKLPENQQYFFDEMVP